MERFKRQFRKYWIRKKYAWKQYQRDILVEEQIQEDGTRPQPDGTDTPPADDPDPDNAPPQPQEAPNFSKKLRKENPRDNSSSYLEPPPRSPHRPLVLNGFARCKTCRRGSSGENPVGRHRGYCYYSTGTGPSRKMGQVEGEVEASSEQQWDLQSITC
ncbi:predicted protein [Pyrenophora tritici-repentis Pt-1C-BFP]|uniref:Uncharacterized protein n=1 Tax=Pyrenophora tritici-repentis (strain Pt-1C-BFP) TaxID=426418 RepID=B2W6B0_PYRTR|nr:uncharacterized protein PTRG_05348 [Pyrenophora tritici-repentis Pt-1C-BFP]EDU48268.1 predicted protein [Pyrenophora tritici-repentis Pt-1C-BFP]